MHRHTLAILCSIVFSVSALAGAAEPPANKAKTASLHVHDDLVKAMEQAPLAMVFRGTSKEDFVKWQGEFRTKLNELLGDSSPPKQWRVVQESVEKLPDHTRYALLLTAPGVPSVPVNLLVPSDLRPGQKVPAVLCVHGHGPLGNDAIVGRIDASTVAKGSPEPHGAFGVQFVRRGYVVAAPCMIPFGRRVDRSKYGGNDPCAVTFIRMQALGRLTITANLRDLRWTIDLLQSRPEVLPAQIGCAGLSYGGRMTMLTAAVDERVKVAAVSGQLNLMQERYSNRHSCGSQMIPGLLRYGDYAEIGGLIAPRPCVWEAGSLDRLIVPKWDEMFRKRLTRAYTAAGVPKRLHFDHFEGGHRWNGDVAYRVFEEVLNSYDLDMGFIKAKVIIRYKEEEKLGVQTEF